MRWILSLALLLTSTASATDLLISGGPIYTSAPTTPTVEAVYVRGDRILFAGGLKAAERFANPETQRIDLAGRTMTAGFIESHGHIMGLGYSKLNLELSDTTSWDEVVRRVEEAASEAEPGEWILGRGWHQSRWTPQPEVMVKGFQTHDKLSAVSPENPVFLTHASGHAAIANARAMEIAGVTGETEFSGDGEVIKDAAIQPTGVFNEIAQSLVQKHIPPPSKEQQRRALALALEEMARFGITSFQDAGSNANDIELYREFLDQDRLTGRLWIMLAGADRALLDDWFERGPAIGLGDHRLTIGGVKLVADGALGSRGAWLLEPYSDRYQHSGLPTMTPEYMAEITRLGFEHGFQICVHAIGDRANREVLNVFDDVFEGGDQGVRFRIEHAQHINPRDIPRFAELGVIASMQGIHMSSDRPWAIDRLGPQRIRDGAYVWRSLIDSGAVLINGTDVPVEPINPVASFYSLVSRRTLAGQPEGGFEPAQKLTRREALHSYTQAAAWGAFEEADKGSIEAGKLADFTIFSQDLMTVPEDQLLDTEISMTIVGGEIVFADVFAEESSDE